MKYFQKIAGIIGIPDSTLKSKIPEEDQKQWEFGVQEHRALRAGKHYDLRLGDPNTKKAYSWAVRYWPKPGERRLAIRQPDHTIPYMDWHGKIKKGYGAGKVKVKYRDKALIETASPDKINFKTNEGKFTLINTDGDSWLILNRE